MSTPPYPSLPHFPPLSLSPPFFPPLLPPLPFSLPSPLPSPIDVIDMVNDAVTGSDYEEEEDPSLFQSPKTGRGPLAQDWIQNPPGGVIMCSYKLIKVSY